AYLNYRAPRLGYRCVELPTTRRYPLGEKVPTKISPFVGDLALLVTLARVCLGLFDPAGADAGRRTRPSDERLAIRLAVLLLIGAAGFVLFRYSPDRNFTPASWGYWELSSGFFPDFFHVNTVRSFGHVAPYGVSFPPLWPTALAVPRALVGAG